MKTTLFNIGFILLIIFCSPLFATVYFVDQNHPAANDEGPGSLGKPFKTISRAVKDAKAGDTVLIRSGVYRETVVINTSGTAEKPICFQAAPEAYVVVTGSDLITDWIRETGSENIFSTPWTYQFNTWSKTMAHPEDDYHKMIGRCEQVFADDYALLQVLEPDKLSRGTFYIDLTNSKLYIITRNNSDLTKKVTIVEASTRSVIWESRGEYVHVRGIIFRHAANPAQKWATNFSGANGIVEDCTFEQMNATGAYFEGKYMIVRRCLFQNNGWDGFDAKIEGLLFSECVVRNNNTKGWNRNWGGGGNKIVLSSKVVIEKSMFLDNRGNGLWFDIGNEECEVRNCLFSGNEGAGIFYEISYNLYAHDNVMIGNGWDSGSGAWGANGAISISSSPNCIIERNLMVANREGFQFREQTRTTPRIGDRKQYPVWNHHQIIRNNIIAYNGIQTGAWFAQPDERHWPSSMQKGTAANVQKIENDIAKDYLSKDNLEQPKGLSLEKLSITMENNFYAVTESQKLIQWGSFRSKRMYDTLGDIQKELNLEKGSTVGMFNFSGSVANRDFRVPANSPAVKMNCYPQGEVPGVRLGVLNGM